ncbi:MAG: hypothetical protein IKU26_05920 [Clostridia bacterium]|nr:hypothetical protein [Clostridia bacterium]
MQKWNSFTDKQKSYIFALTLAALNTFIFLLPPLTGFTFETRAIPLWLGLCSLGLFLAHIPFCIFLRAQKRWWIARGIFLYELVGGLAYVAFFLSYIICSGHTGFSDGALTLFRWWTLGYQPIIVTLSRVIGVPLKFTMGVFYLLHVELYGYTVTAIRKDIRYEKEREEDRLYEEATRGRGGNW